MPLRAFRASGLKPIIPLEFMVAVINNFGGFYRTWVYVHEAKRYGATIQLPCVNKSNLQDNYIRNRYIPWVYSYSEH